MRITVSALAMSLVMSCEKPLAVVTIPSEAQPTASAGRPPDQSAVRRDSTVAAQVLARSFAPAVNSPISLALAAEPRAARPVQTLSAVKTQLKTDPELQPAAAALKAAGMTDEAVAVLMTQAGAYNSSTEADPNRAVLATAREAVHVDLKRFVDSVREAGRLNDLAIDEPELVRRMYSLEASPTANTDTVK